MPGQKFRRIRDMVDVLMPPLPGRTEVKAEGKPNGPKSLTTKATNVMPAVERTRASEPPNKQPIVASKQTRAERRKGERPPAQQSPALPCHLDAWTGGGQLVCCCG